MANKIKVGFIGAGNMGAAIIAGACKVYSISVCDLDKRRVSQLRRKYKVKSGDIKGVCEQSQMIVLAIKPQNFDEVIQLVSPHITRRHVVVSIAAGITTQYIEKRLPIKSKVIRTMPNLPAQAGLGVTGIAGGKAASAADLKKVQKLFSTVGEARLVAEKDLDAITAVSGSGPAYVFLFIESLVQASRSMGLDQRVSEDIVLQTLKGSVALLEQQKVSAEELRHRVTSKGGTTAAALAVLQQKKFQVIVKQALKAAQQRAKQLSR